MPKATFPSDLRGMLVLTGLVLVGLNCRGAAAAETPGWDPITLITVDRANAQHGLLEAAFTHLTSQNIDGVYAARVMARLEHHVDDQIKQGRTATLCLGLIVDLIAEASITRWSEDDAGRLLLALQKEMDAYPRPPMKYFKQSIAGIGQGKTVDQILAGSTTPSPSATARR